MPYQLLSDIFAYFGAHIEQRRVRQIVDIRRDIRASFFDSRRHLQPVGYVKGYADIGQVVREALELSGYSMTAREFAWESARRVAGTLARAGETNLTKKYVAMYGIVEALSRNPNSQHGIDDQLALVTKLIPSYIDFAACVMKKIASDHPRHHTDSSMKVRKAILNLEDQYLYQRHGRPSDLDLRQAAVMLPLIYAMFSGQNEYRLLDSAGRTKVMLSRESIGFKDSAPCYQLFLPHDRSDGREDVVYVAGTLNPSNFDQNVGFRSVCVALAVEMLRMPEGEITNLGQLNLVRHKSTCEISSAMTSAHPYKITEIFMEEGVPPDEEQILLIVNQVLIDRRLAAVREIGRLQQISQLNPRWVQAFHETLRDLDPLAPEREFARRHDALPASWVPAAK